jgi:protocatechuate 3,4-dioxygenase beta subunit
LYIYYGRPQNAFALNRYKFLSLIGLSFIGAPLLSGKPERTGDPVTDCNDPITPAVPEGPFYKRENLNRVNITENKKGIPITYLFRVEDEHCKPIEGAIVDIWQCDSDGVYSDFKQENTVNQTWLRGYQKTDKKGECQFEAIFPGWYNGRITHLHVKVIIGDKNVLTTNCFFPKEIEHEVYKSPLYPKGINPQTVSQDIELHVDKDSKRFDSLVMNVQKDTKGNLVAKYTIAIV